MLQKQFKHNLVSNTIFKGYNLNCQQNYDTGNKSYHMSSLISETPSYTPSKSDLNETAEKSSNKGNKNKF